MERTSLAKALIINLDSGERFECLFNPNEYTYSKQNHWLPGGGAGHDTPMFEFEGGLPITLQMQLFFDTFAAREDVRARHTENLWRLMLVSPELRDAKTQKSRPPMVRFQWGKTWSFDAVITSIAQRFTLFLDDGTPVRAMLDVSFQQIRDDAQLKPQNPTSGGEGGQRIWTVRAGDTLAWLAYKVYGDPLRWQPIAEANQLGNLRRLRPGTELEIPNA